MNIDFTMVAMRIDGKKLSARIRTRLKKEKKPQKKLVGILVGRDTSSLSFLRVKQRAAHNLRIKFELRRIPAHITETSFVRELKNITADPRVGGVVVQLPLPKKFSCVRVVNCVPPTKDPDCLTRANLKKFAAGKEIIKPVAIATVEEILKHIKFDIAGKNVAVVGAGLLIGRPIAHWPELRKKAAKITVYTKRTARLCSKLRSADLIISGAGRAHLFSANDVKEDTVIIDFGYDKKNGRVAGDFNPTAKQRKKFSYTPTPNGTGPIVVAKLLENFYILNSKK